MVELNLRPPDGVERLRVQSEALFEAGQRDYSAGHLDEARKEFDASVDVLLASGFDLSQEHRLHELYEHIVETVHMDEMAAFRQGDSFTEQSAQSSPLDELPDLNLPPNLPMDPRLRGSAEGEIRSVEHDLPLTVNDYVLTYMNYFQTPHGRAIVENGLRRAGRYREMISRVLREEGLPQDLIFLAQAESAFQPQALSKAGARGLWQFMSSSGRIYGLQKTWWVDDRQDPEKATRAAARQLRDLYQMFGDWYLAMAAYDAGPLTIQRAVERTGYADFWELYARNVLPKETRNYVPIILALTLISKDPARYGVDVDPETAAVPDDVKPGHPIDLRLAAETIDTDLETLRTLNPELLRLITPNDPEFVLHLPEGTAERFYAAIAAIPPDKWVSWRQHRVEEGDTLSSIAQQYRVGAAAIAEANALDAHAPLETGTKLIIPVEARTESAMGKLLSYRVRRGDTLESIADEFDVSTAELRHWNHMRSGRVVRGMRLRIYPGGMAPPPAPSHAHAAQTANSTSASASPGPAGPVHYRVKPGETLWSIARSFQTTVEVIRQSNRYLISRPLEAGDELTILPAR
ncbi:MAG: LysM peptidoglycan-binding domain-containing protein [Candidatus Acidiferrales bacterium]